MWLCLNNAFLSIVKKDCPPGSLLVRARRPGDIERVFGTKVEVTRSTDSDYLLRSIVPIEEVELALARVVKEMLACPAIALAATTRKTEMRSAILFFVRGATAQRSLP